MRTTALTLGAAFLSLAFSLPAVAAEKFTNLDYGITVAPPANWKSIPAPKEMGPRYQREESWLMLTRFKAPNPDSENCEIVLDVLVWKQASDLDQAVKAYEARRNAPGSVFKIEKTQAWKVAGRPAVHLQSERGGGFYENAFLVPGDRNTYILSFVSGAKYGRRKAESFRELVKGVAFLDEKQIARLSSSAKTSGSGLPPGWRNLRTPSYDIQYDTDEGFAKLVGKHLEAILLEYQRRFPMEKVIHDATRPAAPERRFTVKCFKDQEAFDSYAAANGVTGAAAYFSPAQNELVCYKTVDEGRKKTLHILYHEASHQYMHQYMGEEADIPIWLNEGVAEYFYGGEFQGDKLAIGVNRERISVIKEAVRRDTFVPLSKILHYTQSEYYADSSTCYAEGWSLAHFLWHTNDPKYQGRINTFYDVLKSTKSKEQAFEKALGDLDLALLEADWKQYVLKL